MYPYLGLSSRHSKVYTRVIIDCTELYCQVPSALNNKSSLYSTYKHHVTYKGFIGIAPSGAVTFVSPLYQGKISDKEIVGKCGLLDHQLWDANRESVMEDRVFTIEDDLNKINVAWMEGINWMKMRC